MVIEAKDVNKHGKDQQKSDEFKDSVNALKKSLGAFLQGKK